MTDRERYRDTVEKAMKEHLEKEYPEGSDIVGIKATPYSIIIVIDIPHKFGNK